MLLNSDNAVDQLEPLLAVASVPATIVNWCGDEAVSVQQWSAWFGELLGVEPPPELHEVPGHKVIALTIDPDLLMDIQRENRTTLLFISHDLGVVEHLSDRVVIMYLGRVVEQAPTAAIFANPRHPYTRSLLDAIPVTNPRDRRHRTLVQQADIDKATPHYVVAELPGHAQPRPEPCAATTRPSTKTRICCWPSSTADPMPTTFMRRRLWAACSGIRISRA